MAKIGINFEKLLQKITKTYIIRNVKNLQSTLTYRGKK